eukprot:6415372-Amphidinium_carterae.1
MTVYRKVTAFGGTTPDAKIAKRRGEAERELGEILPSPGRVSNDPQHQPTRTKTLQLKLFSLEFPLGSWPNSGFS